MDFKKLNEQLERYVFNEISAKLANKVYRKRLDQLNKLQKKVDKDSSMSYEKGRQQIIKVFSIIENWMKNKFKKIEKKETDFGYLFLGGYNPHTKYTYIGLELEYNTFDEPILKFKTVIANYYGKNNGRFSNKLRRVEGVVENGETILSIPLDLTAEELIELLEKDYKAHKGLAEQIIDIDKEILKILQEDPDIQLEEEKNVGMEMHGGGSCYDQNAAFYKDVWFNTIFKTKLIDYNNPLTYTIEMYTGFQGSTQFTSIEDFKNNFKKILERTYKRRLRAEEKRTQQGKPKRKKTVTNMDLSGPIIQAGTYYIGKE